MRNVRRVALCAGVLAALCSVATRVTKAQLPWASFCIGSNGETDTWYVDGTVSASGAGDAWSRAFKTLQEALTAADAAHVLDPSALILIKVADGTYWPDSLGNDPDATFLIRGKTKVHGSYRGNLEVGEPGSPDDRLIPDVPVPVLVPQTIFGTSGSSIKHVVTIEDSSWDNTTVFPSNLQTPALSGVSIGCVGVADYPGACLLIKGDETKSVVVDQVVFSGFAPGNSNPGGGAVNITGHDFPAQFTRCRFFANTAQTNGGAVRNDGAPVALTFYLCDFRLNLTSFSDQADSDPDTATGRGRGADIYSTGGSWVQLFACRFAQSESVDGASVFIDDGTLRAVSCDWTECWGHTEDPPSGVQARGGAVFTRNDSSSVEDQFENCTFVQNSATGQGSSLFLNNPSLITNCTIAYSGGNRTTGSPESSPDTLTRPEGSAVYFNANASSSAINNSIIWQNYRWIPASSGYLHDLTAQVGWNPGGGTPTIAYSNIKDLSMFPGMVLECPVCVHNAWWNRLGPAPSGPFTNLDLDPLFVRNANYFVYIPTRSPCYDAGNNLLASSATSDPGDVNADCSFDAMVGFDVHKFVDGLPTGLQSRVFNFRTIDMGAIEVPFCRVDLDDGSGNGFPDGGVDINDLLFFLAHFELGDKFADIDGDGGVTIDDLLIFLIRFDEGC